MVATSPASRGGLPPVTSAPPSTPERCRIFLERWRDQLRLSPREATLLGPQLANLDRQLRRFTRRRPQVAVFGRVGVGKSSLLNALLENDHFTTDVAHGCTRRQERRAWEQRIKGLKGVDLVDTPGIDEIAAAGRERLASRVALGSDLVLLVIDADLGEVEAQALRRLLASGKPLLLVLNRIDCWPSKELPALLSSIRRRLPLNARHLDPLAVAAAPRQARIRPDGTVRSDPGPALVEPLRRALIERLESQGELMLALNALREADQFSQSLHRARLRFGRRQAHGLIGRHAALKATGVAANPLLLLDLAGGLAFDSVLVMQLCQLYGLPLGGAGARELLGRLSGQSALLGGVQLGVQLVLGGLRQLLLIAAPFSAGLSLAPIAPVAIAQAALAVHTTRRTGRLATAELLRGASAAGQPGALLRRLVREDPQTRSWLLAWGRDGECPADDS